MTLAPETDAPPGPVRVRRLIPLAALAVALAWASWPSWRAMAVRWSEDPRYSHGFLVPLFAGFLLWLRRPSAGLEPPRSGWWGVALVGLGEVVRLAGARYYLPWVESVSLLPSLAGLSVLAGGWPGLRWAAPSVAFLAFMIPLPYRVEHALGYPLQRGATRASNYALQTLGLPAVAEGNVILLDHGSIGVVEACNGLGMLFTFFALAVAMAMVIRRDTLSKALVILSAVPISLGANVVRIVLTGFLQETAGSRVADHVYHDLAGWLMMPMAVAAFWLVLVYTDRLFVDVAAERSAAPGYNPAAAVAVSRGWVQRPSHGGRGSGPPP